MKQKRILLLLISGLLTALPAFASGDGAANHCQTHMLLVAKNVPGKVNIKKADPDYLEEYQVCSREHHEYIEALDALGFTVEEFNNSIDFSASMFVEDPGVMLGYYEGAYHMVITRVGSEWRKKEGRALKKHLENPGLQNHFKKYRFVTYDMRKVPGATLDGGDVLRIEDQLFIGLSPHTNIKGARYLAEKARLTGLTPHIINVPKGLHLKSSCCLAASQLIVYDPKLAGEELLQLFSDTFPDYDLMPVEHLGSNVLFLGTSPKTGRECALVAATAPDTALYLEKTVGLQVIRLKRLYHESLSGRLTCCSIRLPLPFTGSWST